ncbi:MAG: glycosyltransferase [Solirubrobacterales bacterium]
MSTSAQPLRPTRTTALVHDFLLDVRGAERVFAELCRMWPHADVFTAVYDEKGTEGRWAHRTINTTFLQRLRATSRSFRSLLPLYPFAIERLDLREYELVVSSSSAWAHGVLTEPGSVHVCYCHNPFRYAWNEREATLAARSPLMRPALAGVFSRWRQWDWIAAQRVDLYVANSEVTRQRIATYFNRESVVVHPPVDVTRFAAGPGGEHYLVLSELMSHKRIDVAVEAFTRLGLPLVVVGDGPALPRLRRMAGPTISFTGRLGDREVTEMIEGCRALVVPGTEEFGIAAVEAMAAGRPVVGHDAGGLRETVVEGVTGTLFSPSDAAGLTAAVERLESMAIDPADCRSRAEEFGIDRFEDRMRATVDTALEAERVAGDPDARPNRARGLGRPIL